MKDWIIKNLKQTNKELSAKEIEQKAEKIIKDYDEKNKGRDAIREKEHQESFQKSVSSDFYQHLFSSMDEEE